MINFGHHDQIQANYDKYYKWDGIPAPSIKNYPLFTSPDQVYQAHNLKLLV